MAEVRLVGVQKAYGDVPVLRDIDLHIRDGEFMVFVGPSGCGKSTLLRTIAGLEEITGGQLYIGAREVHDVPPAERGVAMVFQSYALYPHMNLYDNMAFGLKLARLPPAEIDTAVRNAAKILHIEHLLQRKPKDLSGGQRQRVAIGRAIVRQPEVFLFDEPLSNLDTALRVKMRYEFAKLHEQLKTTMVYVTHDQVEAMTLADRIVVLSAGRIEQVGAPLDLYEHPCNRFVAGFIGSPGMNFIAVQAVDASAACVHVQLPDGGHIHCAVDGSGVRPGESLTLGLRPEHLDVGDVGDAGDGGWGVNRLAAPITFVESLGGTTFAYAAFPGMADDEALTVGLDGALRLKAGDVLELGVPAHRTYLFDAQGRALRRHAAPEERQAA